MYIPQLSDGSVIHCSHLYIQFNEIQSNTQLYQIQCIRSTPVQPNPISLSVWYQSKYISVNRLVSEGILVGRVKTATAWHSKFIFKSELPT